MEDAGMAGFVRNLMLNDLAPGIPYEVPEGQAEAFGRKVLDRFRNPNLDHHWLSITLQYTSKMKMRNLPTLPNWTFHPANLGEAAAQMYAYDFDGDGDQDVVSSSAHAYGIWWHEQTQDEQGKTHWKQHLITKDFSQTHGLSLVDLNRDGHPDLVTGKRYFAHMGKDPGEYEPAVLYWFELKSGKNPQWTPHLIDDNSGVGVEVVTQDVTKNGLTDIVVANKKGVFLFEQLKR